LERGQRLGVLRQVYFGRDSNEVENLATHGHAGVTFGKFWGHFGFCEAFRLPSDEERWPKGKAMLPESEWTVDRMKRSNYLLTGKVDDVRREMDALIEAANPEYFCWMFDQGLLPGEVLTQQLRTFGEQVLPHYI
jgi:hypothetical protein